MWGAFEARGRGGDPVAFILQCPQWVLDEKEAQAQNIILPTLDPMAVPFKSLRGNLTDVHGNYGRLQRRNGRAEKEGNEGAIKGG